jgi:hypothetical protein
MAVKFAAAYGCAVTAFTSNESTVDEAKRFGSEPRRLEQRLGGDQEGVRGVGAVPPGFGLLCGLTFALSRSSMSPYLAGHRTHGSADARAFGPKRGP